MLQTSNQYPAGSDRAHRDTATAGFPLSPPAERGERARERSTNAKADEGSGFPA